MAEAEQELGSDPQAEVAAALIAVDDSVGQPAAAEISEAELIAAADVAKRSSRRARRQLNAR